MISKKTEYKKDHSILIISIISFVVVLGLWFGTILYFKGCSNETRGTYGDMFGTVNALFSGLAFGGIIITILLQRKELGLQREELHATRKEFEIQNDTMKLQRFENTFFNMINLHHLIVNSINIEHLSLNSVQEMARIVRTGEKVYEKFNGRNAFPFLVKIFHDIYHNDDASFDESYDVFFKEYQSVLGHYFRNLYHIFKLIKNSDIKNKMDYASLIIAQLSVYELLLIFYNCNSWYGKKFLVFAHKYELFKNLDKRLIKNQYLWDYYVGKTKNI